MDNKLPYPQSLKMLWQRIPHHKLELVEENLYIEIFIRVIPNAKKEDIYIMNQITLKYSLVAPPIDGKANLHMIKGLAKKFGLPKSSICIQSGEKSKLKKLSIEYPSHLFRKCSELEKKLIKFIAGLGITIMSLFVMTFPLNSIADPLDILSPNEGNYLESKIKEISHLITPTKNYSSDPEVMELWQKNSQKYLENLENICHGKIQLKIPSTQSFSTALNSDKINRKFCWEQYAQTKKKYIEYLYLGQIQFYEDIFEQKRKILAEEKVLLLKNFERDLKKMKRRFR